MTEEIDLSLILPAYNERASIAETIRQAFAYFASRRTTVEIIVAADGNDGRRELVGEIADGNPNLEVIDHAERGGKGRVIREAMVLARGRIVGFADADNKVPIEEYDKIRPWLKKGYEAVTGSRGLEMSRVVRAQPWFRRIGAQGFYYFMKAVVGLPGIRDTQCGFKFFARNVALRLFELQRIDGYMFDVEILAIARRFGYRIQEVPIIWRDDGDRRLQLISGNLRIVTDVFKIRSYCRQHSPAAAAVTAVAADD